MTFRFDAGRHEYTALDTGEVLPHITEMLERMGWSDSTWMTQESRERGTEVHRLCAAYDLDALDLETCKSPYREYVLAYAKFICIGKPTIHAVEEPYVHPLYRFGGRPDRRLRLYGCEGVLEIKSGAIERSHRYQTALQAILIAPETHLPPHSLARWCLYLTPSGRFKLESHTLRADFDEAHRILAKCRHA